MEIKTEAMLHALNEVKPGLATKSIIQQMENVTFTGNDIITYNDQICVLYPFETDFSASIRHKDLMKIITKISTETFDMTLNDNEVLIAAKSTKAGLTTIIEDEISTNIDSLIRQLPNDDNEIKWQDLPAEFMSGAMLCISAAETDMSKGILACLYTNGKDLICSDNQRVSWYQLTENLNAEFFIKATILSELSHFEFKQFSISDAWINFKTENDAVFSTRLVKGKAMDYFLKVFNGFDDKKIPLPEGLSELIDSASVMAEDEDQRGMKITFEENRIVCSTQSSRGWIEKEMPVEYKDNTPTTFMISAKYLRQISGLPLTMTIGENKSLFESGNFKHVLIHRVV
jgi:DNA polymerase III sliding clamp (beta) subunit (PCNA family)